LSVLISLGNMLVMTWWIGPHAYGIFVTAVGFTTFFAGVARLGVDTYLIRCQCTPHKRNYDIAFTVVLSMATLLVCFGLCILPLLKRWYGGSEFVLPYLALLASVPLTALAGVPTARLERDLNFRAAAAIELTGQTIAFITSLCLAARGCGVWAPVGGMFLWQIFGLAATCRAASFLPRLAYDIQYARTILGYGAGVSLSLRTWQLRGLVNPVLVGRFAGLEAVAYIAFALRVAEGLGFLRTVASRLGIAALARLQHNPRAFRAALEKALLVQVITLGPLLAAFVFLGPSITRHFFGQPWSAALNVYPFIAAGVLVNSVFNLQASALFVVGREWVVMRAYTSHVLILVLATCVFVPRLGIAGYGWAELLACCGYIFILSSVDELVTVSYRKLLPVTGIFLLPPFLQIANLYW
jgi:PST family polysaccharide transporter